MIATPKAAENHVAESSPSPSGKESGTDPAASPTIRLPWALIAAILVSDAALYRFTQDASREHTEGSPLVLVLAIALIATRAISIRMPHASWLPWIMRIVAFGLISSVMPTTYDGRVMLFGMGAAAVIGQIWAIEIVIQAWRERPAGSPPGSSLILMAMLEFTSAASISEYGETIWSLGGYVMYLTPLFILLLLLSFRALSIDEERCSSSSVSTDSSSSSPSVNHTHHSSRQDSLPEGLMSSGFATLNTEDSLPFREGQGGGTVEQRRVERTPARLTVMRGIAVLAAVAGGFACWAPVHNYREQLNLWGNNLLLARDRMPEPTGLSTSPTLGDMFNAEGSPKRVLLLQDYQGDPHLRGLNFDTYDHGSWLPSYGLRTFGPTTSTSLRSNLHGTTSQVTCYADNLKILLGPLETSGIAPANADDTIEQSVECGLLLRIDAASPYRYDLIDGGAPASQGIFCAPPTSAERARCLAVPPEIELGVRQMAARIGGGVTRRTSGATALKEVAGRPSAGLAESELRKIDAVTDYLLQHYSYSLSIQSGPGDRISDFLLHQHAAHCEYFASSATILLRCLGVPTRYVTGYYAHEGEGDGVVVRQRDSHAWAESWVDGVGWVTVDATPGDGRPDKLYPGIPWIDRTVEWLTDRTADVQTFLGRYTQAQISLAIGGVALALMFVHWLWRRRRVRRPASASTTTYTPPDLAILELGNLFEDYLRRIGMPCPPDVTWREHLAACAPGAIGQRQSIQVTTVAVAPANGHSNGVSGNAPVRRSTESVLNWDASDAWDGRDKERTPPPPPPRKRRGEQEPVACFGSEKHALGSPSWNGAEADVQRFVKLYNRLRFSNSHAPESIEEARQLLDQMTQSATMPQTPGGVRK